MPQIESKSSKPVTAVLVLLLASLVLAACGSSKGSTTSTTASASKSTTTGRGTGAGGRFTALRECLQKDGVTLPKRTPGQGRRPDGQGGFLGGGASGAPQLPKGVTRAQFEAALKKCGGGAFGRGRGAGAGLFNSPATRQALAKYATCLRNNGVKVPAPNTSGKGPVFNTNGLNTSSPQFKTAQKKCVSVLRGLFRSRPGGAGPRGPGAAGGPGSTSGPGAPPAGGPTAG